MLGFPLLYFEGMRLMMFQLSSFYCIVNTPSSQPNREAFSFCFFRASRDLSSAHPGPAQTPLNPKP